MPISLNTNLMRAIILDHYQNPRHKSKPKKDGYLTRHLNSVNCIDDINIYLFVEKNIITDCLFDGVACTISTASTDIMCDLVINKTKDEALYIIKQYEQMIYELPFDESVLDEAIVFMNTYKQPARIKCAILGWEGLEEILLENEEKR
ncbi:MAG: SUF system NifU family Fe-S cluster assembly protein [Bacilli bacterium]|jgi:nitrogen fixation NifU-like protein|nr:SUF system NifU family Fe-S cluster assembly protein [Bacilli bacterium]NLN80436.1 SUF system NifU family Fe-S cluster assembly protein [Erysipelotrichia bacterium]